MSVIYGFNPLNTGDMLDHPLRPYLASVITYFESRFCAAVPAMAHNPPETACAREDRFIKLCNEIVSTSKLHAFCYI